LLFASFCQLQGPTIFTHQQELKHPSQSLTTLHQTDFSRTSHEPSTQYLHSLRLQTFSTRLHIVTASTPRSSKQHDNTLSNTQTKLPNLPNVSTSPACRSLSVSTLLWTRTQPSKTSFDNRQRSKHSFRPALLPVLPVSRRHHSNGPP
jgi:hypothetical protein